jgi:hypothetical protein
MRLAVRLVAVLVAFGALTLTSCKHEIATTPIKTLLDDPGRFDGQVVRIAGDVSEAMSVLGYGTYQLSDGTGKLRVVTKEGGAPRDGARVGVEGTFRAAFTLGTQSAAVLKETRRFTL